MSQNIRVWAVWRIKEKNFKTTYQTHRTYKLHKLHKSPTSNSVKEHQPVHLSIQLQGFTASIWVWSHLVCQPKTFNRSSGQLAKSDNATIAAATLRGARKLLGTLTVRTRPICGETCETCDVSPKRNTACSVYSVSIRHELYLIT